MKKLLCILSALFILAGCKTESSGKTDNTEDDNYFIPQTYDDWVGTYKSTEGDFSISFNGEIIEIRNLPIKTSEYDDKYGEISKVYIHNTFNFITKNENEKIVALFLSTPYGSCDFTTYTTGNEINSYSDIDMDISLYLELNYEIRKSIKIKSANIHIRRLNNDNLIFNNRYYDNAYIEFSNNEIILERQD